MQVEEVSFYSEGVRISGLLKKPTDAVGPLPVVVQGPGWLGLASSPTSQPYHQGFVDAGYAVLIFDYRGFGASDGDPGWVRPEQQREDIYSAITYVETRDDLDEDRLGLFGLGGTGGGNALIAAALDTRPKCVVVQTVVADGRDWMRQMRREHEWVTFQERVRDNGRRMVLTGEDELVNPREELMVATPERHGEQSRKETDAKTGDRFHLSSAESLLRFRPIDYVDRIAPRGVLITCIENDVVTPEDHAASLFHRAGEPKMMVRQVGVKHYEAYQKNYDRLMPLFLEWYGRFLRPSPATEIRSEGTGSRIVTI